MKRNVELAKELYEYTKVIGSHNLHIQGVAAELVSNLEKIQKSHESDDWKFSHKKRGGGMSKTWSYEPVPNLTVKQVKEILDSMPEDATFYMWGTDGKKRHLGFLKDLKLNPDKTSVGMTIHGELSMDEPEL